ncbi:MAG: hypothetical protein R3300_13395 [Candidatus Promineifilaceae bacterium]|nr:hypothetical protein [Candidatus Promineifilaceae bacterium]
MRLERKKEAELARRKGNAVRTIIMLLWLLFSGLVAWGITEWLQESGTLTIQRVRTYLFLSPEIDSLWIRLGMMLIIIMAMQLVLLFVFAMFSKSARRRPGDASLYSRQKEGNVDKYDYR